jgi:hypothetical protein
MTRAQWFFEYHAVSAMEQDKLKFTEEIYKATIQAVIKLLGLNVAAFCDDYDGTQEKIVPFSMLAGNHHLLPKIMETVKKQLETEKTGAISNPDPISDISVDDLGDLDPVLFGDLSFDHKKYVNSIDFQQALKSLGIKPANG